MKVLIACEFSGIVRQAFSDRGHVAMSCDLEETEIPGWHYKGDVFDIIDMGWDLMIAHPPCTYLCNSGVRHLSTDHYRWQKLNEATDFFNRLLNCNIPKICIENPIPHGYAVDRIGIKYSQIIQPWMFGHPEQKSTCLWLKNLTPLKETDNVKAQMKLLPKNEINRIHYMAPGKNRTKERSRTYSGIAAGMSTQWG